jgi:hypothetical protein
MNFESIEYEFGLMIELIELFELFDDGKGLFGPDLMPLYTQLLYHKNVYYLRSTYHHHIYSTPQPTSLSLPT